MFELLFSRYLIHAVMMVDLFGTKRTSYVVHRGMGEPLSSGLVRAWRSVRNPNNLKKEKNLRLFDLAVIRATLVVGLMASGSYRFHPSVKLRLGQLVVVKGTGGEREGLLLDDEASVVPLQELSLSLGLLQWRQRRCSF